MVDVTAQMTPVRLAVQEDLAVLVPMCKMLHGENGLFPLSDEKLQELLDRHFQKRGAIIGVIGEVGNPLASIYLGITQFSYSDEWLLLEEWTFVHPDHRKTNYARSLIAYAKGISDQMKLPLMTGILSNKRTEAKVHLYEQLMDKVGAYFIYNRQFSSAAAWG